MLSLAVSKPILQVRSALVYRRDDAKDLTLVEWVLSQSPPAVPHDHVFDCFTNPPEAMKEFSSKAIPVRVSFTVCPVVPLQTIHATYAWSVLETWRQWTTKASDRPVSMFRECFASKHLTSL